MPKIKYYAAAVAFLTVGAFSAAAHAQDVRAACMGDYQRFCSDVMVGGGRIVACLSQHLEALNPVCAEAVSLGAQCMPDSRRFCGGISTDGGTLRTCLQEHSAKLTPACAAALSKAARN
jgi:hypothetical protein